MFDLVLGAGQGGSRIAKAFAEAYGLLGYYFNLTDVDFSRFDVPQNHIFVLNEGGTGRDATLGEDLVREYQRGLYDFLNSIEMMPSAKHIALCIGGGGGSGTGFMFPILEFLKKRKKEVFLIFTLPQRKEGLPAQPNALRALNRLITEYIGSGIDKTKQIAPLLVDNDYCYDKYGQFKEGNELDYWSKVNKAIAYSLRRFYALTNLEKHKTYYDIAAGYNSLDLREFMRILFFKEGFLDIREMVIESFKDVENLRSGIKSSSLVNGSMDINTTKAYIVSVAIPESWKQKHAAGMNAFIEQCFDAAAKMTRTSFVLRSSYYSPKINTARVSLLLAGMTKSHGLDKHVKSAQKNVEKFKNKGAVSALNLEGLDF